MSYEASGGAASAASLIASDACDAEAERFVQCLTDAVSREKVLSESLMDLIPPPMMPLPASQDSDVLREPQSGDVYECVITKQNGGLGLTVAYVNDHVQVTGLADETPAASSGICIGDTLVAVSGLAVHGLRFGTIVGYLKSPARKSVVLKLRRNPCTSSYIIRCQSESLIPQVIVCEDKDGPSGRKRSIELTSKSQALEARFRCKRSVAESGSNDKMTASDDQLIEACTLAECRNLRRQLSLCQQQLDTERSFRFQWNEQMLSRITSESIATDANLRKQLAKATFELAQREARDAGRSIWEMERLQTHILYQMDRLYRELSYSAPDCERQNYHKTIHGVRESVLGLLFPTSIRTLDVSSAQKLHRDRLHDDVANDTLIYLVTTENFQKTFACDFSELRNLKFHGQAHAHKNKICLSSDGMLCRYNRHSEMLDISWAFEVTWL